MKSPTTQRSYHAHACCILYVYYNQEVEKKEDFYPANQYLFISLDWAIIFCFKFFFMPTPNILIEFIFCFILFVINLSCMYIDGSVSHRKSLHRRNYKSSTIYPNGVSMQNGIPFVSSLIRNERALSSFFQRNECDNILLILYFGDKT